MPITYLSTRGQSENTDFKTALLNGLAPDGGLYVPDHWPQLSVEKLKGLSYPDLAQAVIASLIDEVPGHQDFNTLLNAIYAPDAGIFRDTQVTPLSQVGDNTWLLELYHGPTLAFKDLALQLLARLLDAALAGKGQRATIIGATSGDTGSAAIEACRHCTHVNVVILHPKGRVSEAQRRQMTTVKAGNVHNLAIEGTFDDCQALVKAMFNDADFRHRHNLTAVNSINWARIAAQIVYYWKAAMQFDSAPRFAVPTGNFGNVYAAHAARRMGLGIEELIIGTNVNDALARFFRDGVMQTGTVTPSHSPSMDIQIPSNFERYLHELLGGDSRTLQRYMDDLKHNGAFRLDDNLLSRAQNDFTARRVDDELTLDTMRRVYVQSGRLVDPHTAVGIAAAEQTVSGHAPVIALACAHPAKFPEPVEAATGVRPDLPAAMAGLFDADEHYAIVPAKCSSIKRYINTILTSVVVQKM